LGPSFLIYYLGSSLPFDLTVIHITKSDCMKRKILLPKGKRTYQYILSAMVSAQYSPQQMPAFSAEQKKHARLEQRYKSSPRDPEIYFPVPSKRQVS